MTNTVKKVASIMIAALLLMLVSGLLGGVIGYQKGLRIADCGLRIDTIRIERIDTLRIVERVTDTVTLTEMRPYFVALHDTVTRTDSVWVSLPYERHHYAKPDTLEVWYSGFDAKIDSAIVYNRHSTEIVNHVIEANKMPRLTFGIGAAAAYHERQVLPFAVADLRYNAPRSTWSAFGAVNHEGKWMAGVSATFRIDLIK